MATHIIIAIGIWALVVVGICRTFWVISDRRHPLNDLSDKQADFASLATPLTFKEEFGGDVRFDDASERILIERMISIHSGASK